MTKRYTLPDGSEIKALDSVDIGISRGTFAVLTGPSGCGKSTLLNVIGLLDRSEGSLKVAGSEASGASDADLARLRRLHVGFLFQDGGLIEPMMAGASIELALVYKRTSSHQRQQIVDDALAQVGMSGRGREMVSNLSGGERQRIALARAFATAPNILVCDEPSAALDEGNTRLVASLLVAASRRGVAVVCSSHDPILIGHADIHFRMDRGRITEVSS